MSSWFIRRANVNAGGGPEPTPGRLPSEFRELAYIETTGTQYIDTGIVPNIDCEVYIKAQVVDWLTSGILAGARTGTGNNNRFFVYGYDTSSTDRMIMRATVFTSSTKAGRGVFEILFNEAGTHNVAIDGTNIGTFSTGNAVGVQNTLYIGATSGYSNIKYNSAAKFYSVKIKKGSTEMDLVPALRKADSVVGMYDLLSDTFLTNAGTGTFSYGEL